MSKDFVFWDPISSLNSGNVLLLPGMVLAGSTEPNGAISITSNQSAAYFPSVDELIVAGNPDPTVYKNIRRGYTQYNYLGGATITAVKFNSGGVLSLVSQSGDARIDVTDYANSFSDSDINITQSATYSITGGSNPTYVASGNYESAIFLSNDGTFIINSDLNGNLTDTHSVTLRGYTVGTTLTDNCSGNTSTNAVVRAQSIDLYNNLLGKINVSGHFEARGKKAATVNNNTVTVQGLWAETGDFTCGGAFDNTASITVTGSNIYMIADYSEAADSEKKKYSKCLTPAQYAGLSIDEQSKYTWKQVTTVSSVTDYFWVQSASSAMTEAEYNALTGEERAENDWYQTSVTTASASATGNVIGAYGIRADNGTITIKRDFSSTVKTTLDNITVNAIARGEGTTAVTAVFDVTVGSYGFYSQDFVLEGSYLGSITAKADHLTLLAEGSHLSTPTSSDNIKIATIYAENNITVSSWLSGSLTSQWDAGSVTYDHELTDFQEIYGIYAKNTISVGDGHGFFDSTISATQSNDVEEVRTYGIKAEKIYAESLGAKINVVAQGNGYAAGIGVSASKFENNTTAVPNIKKSSFDIIGDITATTAAIEGSQGVNLRIASTISATYYSIVSEVSVKTNGTLPSQSTTKYDDNIELAAGARAVGTMMLYGGANSVSINSNARLIGDIDFRSGTLNLSFILDRYGKMDGSKPPSNEVIFDGAVTSPVGTTVLIDLNAAKTGEYYLMKSSTGIATANVVYQGITKAIYFTAEGSTIKIGNMDVTGYNNGVNLYVSVTEAPRKLEDFAAASVFIEKNGTTQLICTISNDQDRDMSLYSDYTLWLSYTKKDGTKGLYRKSYDDFKTGVVTFNLTDDVSTISDLNAVLSTNAAKQDDRESWKQTLAVTGSADSKTGKFRISWNLNSPKSVTAGYRYDVEYRISKDNGANWTNSTLVTMDYMASYYEIADMKDNYQVQARVRLVDASSSKDYAIGEWTSVKTYSFASETAAKPIAVTGLNDLISIGNEADAVRRLKWNDMRSQMADGLKRYEIEYFWAVDESGNAITDFTDSELEKAWKREAFDHGDTHVNVTVYSRAVTTNTYILTNLDANAAYYWRVRAVSLKDQAGAWSSTSQFSVVMDDSTAPTASPNGTEITIDPSFDYKEKVMTLSWSGYLAQDETTSQENISYLVYYKAGTESSYSVYQPTKTPKGSSMDYTVTINGYDLNQSFEYYITARDEAGNQSEKLRDATLKGDQTAPVNGAISGEGSYALNTSGGYDYIVTFTITAAKDEDDGGVDSPSGVATTQLQYQKNSTWVTVGEWTDDNVPEDPWKAPGIDTRDIPTNENFECPTYWRLVATDYAGNVFTSDPLTMTAVQAGEISLDPASLQASEPIYSKTDFSITCTWSDATSSPYKIASYTIYARLVGTENWEEIGTAEYGAPTQTVTANKLDGGKTYEWKVVATDEKGFTAEAISPTTIDTPVIEESYKFKSYSVIPAYSGSTMNVTVSWTGSDPSLSDGNYVIEKADIGSAVFSKYKTLTSSDKTISTTFAPDDSYQYRVYTVSKGELVYSDTLAALLDTTTPTFSGSSTSHSTVTGGYQFTYSAASDPTGAKGEGVSGMKEYKLYFDTSSTRSENAKWITTGSTDTTYTLTKAAMKKLGISDGTYYWWVSALDYAGNESDTLTGDSSISIDISGPTRTTLTKMTIPTITVTYNYLRPEEDIEEPYADVSVRDPRTISVKFDVSQNTYTDTNGKYDDNNKYNYFLYEIASDRNFSNIIYSTEKDSYDYLTSQTYEGNTLTLSTTNNGIACLAGYEKNHVFYWRIRAVDTLGNYADDYESGTPFMLVDPEIEYDNGMYAPIQDLYTDPTAPVGFTIDKYSGDDQEWIDQNAYTFRWTASEDAFGIKMYEIMCTNKSTKEVVYQYVDAISPIKDNLRKVSVVFGGFTAGDYQFKMRAYDGSGRKSDWSNTVELSISSSARSKEQETGMSSDTAITLDNISSFATKSYQVSYTLPSNYLGTSANSNEIWYKIGGADTGANHIYSSGMLNLRFTNVNSKLKITLYSRAKGKMKSFSVRVADGGLSNFVYNTSLYSDLMYIQIQNTNKRTYDVTFDLNADLEYFPSTDLGPNSFAEAEANGKKYLGTEGTVTVTDWVGMGDAADYWMMVGGTAQGEPNAGLLNGVNVTGVQAKLKLSLYLKESDGSYRKLASKNISKDATVFENKMVDKNYYVVVESGDNGAGKQNSNYTLTVNESYYPNNHDSQYNPTLLTLGTKLTAQWVGCGDPQNFYKFTVTEDDGDGVFTVDLTTYSAKVTASLYEVANDGSISLISKYVKVKGGKTNIFAKSTPVLAAGKSYMVIVDAGKVTKPSQNTYHDIQVTETETFKYKQQANQNNSFADALELTGNVGDSWNGWVGFNDPENYYKFTCTETTIGTIKPTVSKGKGIASVFYDSSFNEISEKNMAVGGTYYLKVYAKDEKKYFSNDFTVTMQYK